MAKQNTPEQKQALASRRSTATTPAPVPVPSSSTLSSRKKQARNSRPQIGGTAVVGAKSTLPRAIPTSGNQQQQQNESGNRTMRRRMQNFGTGDESSQAQTTQEKRKQQIARRKQRLEARRAELRKSLPNGGKISLGRKAIYFVVSVAVLVIVLILLAVLHQMHVF